MPRAIFVLSKEDLAFPQANAVRNRTKSGANVRMAASQVARIVVQFAQRYVAFTYLYLIASYDQILSRIALWMVVVNVTPTMGSSEKAKTETASRSPRAQKRNDVCINI